MIYIKLGNTDLNVSRICLGCMSFGDASRGMHSWTLDYEKSKEIIQYALDQGINFFDTAMGYQSGTSEEYVGKALKELTKRSDVVIATKFVPQPINSTLTMKEYITGCLEASLKRLDTDYIDLYYLHMWDYHHPIEDILEALNELILAKKIRYIAVSNCYAYQLARANEIAKAHGWAQFICVQGHHNLIFREEEREMKRYCDEENIAMCPYSALASGRLAKLPGETSKRLEEDAFAKTKYDHSKEADELIIQRVVELAQKKEVSMSEIALSWLLTKVTSPIIGATKKHHLDGVCKAVDLELTNEDINYLEELYTPHKIVGVLATNK